MIKPKCVFKNFFKKKERRRWSSGQLLLRLALLRFIPPNSDGNDRYKLSSLCHHHSPINLCDPGAARTRDPYIKSVLLYQLSYGVASPFVGTSPLSADSVFSPFLFYLSVLP